MLIVGSVAHVVVNKDIGISHVKNFSKSYCIFGVTLNKITIEIQVLRITAEAFLGRAILINSVIWTSIQTTTDVVDRNYGQHRVRRQYIFVRNNVPHQKHAGINSIRFARVNTIIDKNDSPIFFSQALEIEVMVFRHYYK